MIMKKKTALMLIQEYKQKTDNKDYLIHLKRMDEAMQYLINNYTEENEKENQEQARRRSTDEAKYRRSVNGKNRGA